MDAQNEYEKIKSLLENSEGLGDISEDFKKVVQERFQLLLTFADMQQQAIKDFLTEFKYEYNHQKTINVTMRTFEHVKEIVDKLFKR